MLSKPTFSEFKTFYEKVQVFFENRPSPWASRLLFEAMKNVSFIKDVSPILDRVQEKLSHKDIDELIRWTRVRTNLYLEKAKNTNSLDKKYDLASTMMAYFGLTECLHEHGVFTERVFDELKSEFGESYLQELQKIDRDFLSVDTQKLYGQTQTKAWPNNEAACKYLVLKQWQDDQHVYYLDNIENFIWPLEDAYIQSKGTHDYFPPNLKHINNINAQKVRCLTEFSEKSLIGIDDLAMAYLAGLDKELIKLIGGKAYGLTVLRAAGANIPETFVSPVTASTLNETDLDHLPNYKYAIRSSADIEDGSKHSFAGMFDSFLDVDRTNITDAFQNVKSSVNNLRVKSYLSLNGLADPHMAIVIQEFKEPTISGVWIGSHANGGVLEWVEGNGEKLVSGKVTPHHEEIDGKVSGENCLTLGGKSIAEQLIQLQNVVSTTGTADFEWCILDDQLVLLQYRPVTASIAKQNELQQAIPVASKDSFKGLAVSPGIVKGPAKFVRKINELDSWTEGDILMAWFTDPEWMHVLSKSSGIVTAVGGFLCHTAIIAREIGIPCVVGIGGDAMKKIWDKTYLSINGTTGVVSANEQKKNLDIRRIKDVQNSK